MNRRQRQKHKLPANRALTPIMIIFYRIGTDNEIRTIQPTCIVKKQVVLNNNLFRTSTNVKHMDSSADIFSTSIVDYLVVNDMPGSEKNINSSSAQLRVIIGNEVISN